MIRSFACANVLLCLAMLSMGVRLASLGFTLVLETISNQAYLEYYNVLEISLIITIRLQEARKISIVATK